MQIFNRVPITTAMAIMLIVCLAHAPVRAAESPQGDTHAELQQKETCRQVEKLKEDFNKQTSVNARMAAVLDITSTRCTTVANLIIIILHRTAPGGRKLEKDRKVPLPEAERQLRIARADLSIRQKIDAELAGEEDELKKLLLEAAVMADQGELVASDLLMAQLASKLGGDMR